MKKREKLSSRLGFVLVSVGCAIGIGNVWRFPYIAGKNGGAIFVAIYLLFLVLLGIPIMTAEFSVGRASKASAILSFNKLEKPGTKWHIYGYFAMLGNYLLMMFYTAVSGWMLNYVFKTARGEFIGKNTDEIGAIFGNVLSNPLEMTIWLIVIVSLGFFICAQGLVKGLEKASKFMMCSLLLIMIILVFKSVTLEGGMEGLKFYLIPNWENVANVGLATVIFEAMNQSFFTLSIGIGAMAIFGSFIGREYSLPGESLKIAVLDTLVAIMAGLIIFPATAAFNVQPGEGPGLIFVTLPQIFNQIAFGRIWGTLFFVFMTFAAFSTVLAVFENIISFCHDLWGWTRKKASIINTFAIIILSLPCILGFNVLSNIQPLGAGSGILDLEDFIVSANLLPLGSLVYLLFCVTDSGWGFDNFLNEANMGTGLKLKKGMRIYLKYVLPLLVLVIFVMGYITKFLK